MVVFFCKLVDVLFFIIEQVFREFIEIVFGEVCDVVVDVEVVSHVLDFGKDFTTLLFNQGHIIRLILLRLFSLKSLTPILQQNFLKRLNLLKNRLLSIIKQQFSLFCL